MAIVALVLVSTVVPAQPARAHAALTASDPADGAVLGSAPDRAILTFSEPVDPLVLTLVAPDAGRSTLRGTVLGSRLLIDLPGALGHGTFTLNWRVVSTDGHPVGGSVVYSVDVPSVAVRTEPSSRGPVVTCLIWIARLGLYLGLLFGVGGAYFTAWSVGGARTGRTAVASALFVGCVAAPLSFGLQGVDALGTSVAGLAAGEAWTAAVATNAGPATLLSGTAIVLGIVSVIVQGGTAARWLSLSALLLVGTALASTGHAATAEPAWLARPAVFLHSVAVAWWLGALVPLAIALRSGGSGAIDVLLPFSRVAPWVVTILVAAGAVLTVLQVPEPAGLLATGYGTVLLLKLALVTLLLGVAAVNRWLLTRRAGEPAAARTLVRLILLETILGVAILGLVALWRFTPPPRTLSMPTEIVSVHVHDARAMADLSLSRGESGLASADIRLSTGDFLPLEAKELAVILSSRGAGVEGIRRQALRRPDGVWTVEGLPVAPGAWELRIDVLVDDFSLVTLEAELEIGR